MEPVKQTLVNPDPTSNPTGAFGGFVNDVVTKSYLQGVESGMEAALMHIRQELSTAGDRETKISLTRLVEGVEQLKKVVMAGKSSEV
jgi:hypothetical protein